MFVTDLVAIVFVTDFYVPFFLLSEAGGMRFSFIEMRQGRLGMTLYYNVIL